MDVLKHLVFLNGGLYYKTFEDYIESQKITSIMNVDSFDVKEITLNKDFQNIKAGQSIHNIDLRPLFSSYQNIEVNGLLDGKTILILQNYGLGTDVSEILFYNNGAIGKDEELYYNNSYEIYLGFDGNNIYFIVNKVGDENIEIINLGEYKGFPKIKNTKRPFDINKTKSKFKIYVDNKKIFEFNKPIK
jgi:hypothetical protein